MLPEFAPGELALGADIAARFLKLAARTFELVKSFPRDPAGRHVAHQLFRSATSCGANYEEARAAESRPDFIHKVGVAAKEIRETLYWLRLAEATRLSQTPIGPLIRESIELAAILVASKRTARRNDGRANTTNDPQDEPIDEPIPDLIAAEEQRFEQDWESELGAP